MLLRVHPGRYLDHLEAMAAAGGGEFDPDTVMSRGSWEAALHAAGAAVAAVGHALERREPAFAAVRPPGHHALAAQAMGFCLLANAVIAAREALARGAERVLIVDWDVHHGNGTQALVQDDAVIRYVSLHQWPAYPGTGAAAERGVGNVFNVPRGPSLPREQYVADLWGAIEAATDGWSPGLVLVSAGYDALRGDPLGGFTLEPPDYAEWVRRLRRRCPEAALVGVLEGGYAPDRLADGVVATLQAMGE